MGNISAKSLPGIFFEQANSLKRNHYFGQKKRVFGKELLGVMQPYKLKLASVLQSYGVKKGDRVLIASENDLSGQFQIWLLCL